MHIYQLLVRKRGHHAARTVLPEEHLPVSLLVDDLGMLRIEGYTSLVCLPGMPPPVYHPVYTPPVQLSGCTQPSTVPTTRTVLPADDSY